MPSLIENGSLLNFFYFVHIFRLFSIVMEKKMSVILNKRECPLPKNALSKVWLILSQWLWRREFKNFVNVRNSAILLISPRGKGHDSFLNTLIPFYQRLLCAKEMWL